MRRFLQFLALPATMLLVGATCAQQPAGDDRTAVRVQQNPPAALARLPEGSPTSQAGEPNSLFDAPPLPKGPVTLVGGTVKNIDRIRNRLTLETFGGGTFKVNFDERSHIYRDGIETTELGIQKGDRVYVDSMLDGPRVFARTIRVKTAKAGATADGQIVNFNSRTGVLTLRDRLSAQAVTFWVGQNTVITHNQQPGSVADLKPGSIISVKFSPHHSYSGSASEIAVEAEPGAIFTFAGKVTNIDLRNGLLSVDNHTDEKMYDIKFSLKQVDNKHMLAIGSQVSVQAVFDGSGYRAQSVTVQAGK